MMTTAYKNYSPAIPDEDHELFLCAIRLGGSIPGGATDRSLSGKVPGPGLAAGCRTGSEPQGGRFKRYAMP